MDEHKHTILVVDDEDTIRRAIAIIFDEDYTVLTAESGEKAIELVQSNPVDLVLLDIRMPGGIDGIETLKRIKTYNASIEVLMVSAVRDKYAFDEAMKNGAREFIEKPFDIDELINRVYRILFEKIQKA